MITRYVGRRLLQGLGVLLIAATIGFLLTNAIGNPSDMLKGGVLDPQALKEYQRSLGYDKPLLSRYVSYIGGLLHGHFGNSYRFNESGMKIVLDALPYTLMLVGGAVVLALSLSVPLAVLSVIRRGSLVDRSMQRGLMVLQGVPEFWLGLVLALVFGGIWRIFPTIGYVGLQSLVLPACALGIPLVPTFVRLMRGQLLDTMQMDFVDALRAKGLDERTIVVRHGLRNVVGPFVTLLALQFGFLIGGSILIEAVFAWPGIGSAALSAVSARDLAVLQSLILLVTVCFVLLNLLADVFVLWRDPRIRLERA
jgi:peptide/nickel transport system permease protein